MGLDVGSDGLLDVDRDESQWCKSDRDCTGCDDNIHFGDECVLLKLVYPASLRGQAVLLDALDEDGDYTAPPILYCFGCWDGYMDELRDSLKDCFLSKRTCSGPSPVVCSFCQKQLNWGDYCARAFYGELDSSPRTKESFFKASDQETELRHAELLCLDCLAWVNAECEENIWDHLWVDYEEA